MTTIAYEQSDWSVAIGVHAIFHCIAEVVTAQLLLDTGHHARMYIQEK